MKNNNIGIFFILLLLLTGCSAPLTKSQRAEINTVAVVNEFPARPNYAIIGTTIFNNKYDELKEEDYFGFVSNVTVGYLSKKGYKTTLITGDKTGLDKKYDLVLTLIPRDIYEMPGTMGYGVNQRSFFGVESDPNVYVALNISPKLHGRNTGNAYYNSVLQPLSFESLPNKWDMLTQAQKSEIHNKLKQNIRKAITMLMKDVGL
jgi:hypothetical protein